MPVQEGLSQLQPESKGKEKGKRALADAEDEDPDAKRNKASNIRTVANVCDEITARHQGKLGIEYYTALLAQLWFDTLFHVYTDEPSLKWPGTRPPYWRKLLAPKVVALQDKIYNSLDIRYWARTLLVNEYQYLLEHEITTILPADGELSAEETIAKLKHEADDIDRLKGQRNSTTDKQMQGSLDTKLSNNKTALKVKLHQYKGWFIRLRQCSEESAPHLVKMIDSLFKHPTVAELKRVPPEEKLFEDIKMLTGDVTSLKKLLATREDIRQRQGKGNVPVTVKTSIKDLQVRIQGKVTTHKKDLIATRADPEISDGMRKHVEDIFKLCASTEYKIEDDSQANGSSSSTSTFESPEIIERALVKAYWELLPENAKAELSDQKLLKTALGEVLAPEEELGEIEKSVNKQFGRLGIQFLDLLDFP